MLLMGDEIGRSQGGNNNSWCQNNPLGWMSWDENEHDLELLSYLKKLVEIRKRFKQFLNPIENNAGFEYKWHGTKINQPDWSSWSHTVAFSINKIEGDPIMWIGLNAYSKDINFCIPKSNNTWFKLVDTSEFFIDKPRPIKDQFLQLKNRSSVLVVASELIGSDN